MFNLAKSLKLINISRLCENQVSGAIQKKNNNGIPLKFAVGTLTGSELFYEQGIFIFILKFFHYIFVLIVPFWWYTLLPAFWLSRLKSCRNPKRFDGNGIFGTFMGNSNFSHITSYSYSYDSPHVSEYRNHIKKKIAFPFDRNTVQSIFFQILVT